SYATIYRPHAVEARSLGWLMTACVAGAVLTELTVQTIVRLRGGLPIDFRSPSMVSIPPEDLYANIPAVHVPPHIPIAIANPVAPEKTEGDRS
ncbi:MAG TPA: hypothetical protein VNO21_12425, partial [Polyangiaceae bacterium]|nr:hypothetical protein [Polyangiaceae bacterium]